MPRYELSKIEPTKEFFDDPLARELNNAIRQSAKELQQAYYGAAEKEGIAHLMVCPICIEVIRRKDIEVLLHPADLNLQGMTIKSRCPGCKKKRHSTIKLLTDNPFTDEAPFFKVEVERNW